jgi:uncharacterized coiled-coil protein SlyX
MRPRPIPRDRGPQTSKRSSQDRATGRTASLSRLLDRVIQQRRQAADPPAPPEKGVPDDRLTALEDRVAQLERLIEGLQDSVHRVTVRHQREMEALNQKTEPAQMARALGRHSREKGL